MRKILIGFAAAALVAVVAFTAPSGAQTTSSTTTTTYVTPGMVDALVITGEPVCTAAGAWEITWTLENVWTSPIGFIFAYSENQGGPYGAPVRTPLQLDPIDAGAATVVVTTFPGGSRFEGTAVLQTEAYFVPEEATGGPVGVAVRLPGTCAVAEVAVETDNAPAFTG